MTEPIRRTSSKRKEADIGGRPAPQKSLPGSRRAPEGGRRRLGHGAILVLVTASLGILTTSIQANASPLCPRPVIHIYKRLGLLILTCQGKVRLQGPVSFGGTPSGPKHRSGDQRTPEGRYRICVKKRSARYHKFLGLSYPGPRDAAWGLKRHLISRAQYRRILRAHRRHAKPPWTTKLGGAIGIHGATGKSFWVKLWNGISRIGQIYRTIGFTDGCIMATNDLIDRLYARVKIGTPVIIHP